MKFLIAKDEAFSFVYRANIDALARLGEVSFFSPMVDEALPPCDVLYLPGGYPELFADRLADNTGLCKQIAAFAHDGGRVLAECGGFMFLCRSLCDREMCGVFPFDATMEGARLHLGYRQMTIGDQSIKGHEFHYSSLLPYTLPTDITERCIQRNAMGEPVGTPIYRYRNVVAGYTHWYWAETNIELLWQIH